MSKLWRACWACCCPKAIIEDTGISLQLQAAFLEVSAAFSADLSFAGAVAESGEVLSLHIPAGDPARASFLALVPALKRSATSSLFSTAGVPVLHVRGTASLLSIFELWGITVVLLQEKGSKDMPLFPAPGLEKTVLEGMEGLAEKVQQLFALLDSGSGSRSGAGAGGAAAGKTAGALAGANDDRHRQRGGTAVSAAGTRK